jgi:transcriptional antiterminator NusG
MADLQDLLAGVTDAGDEPAEPKADDEGAASAAAAHDPASVEEVVAEIDEERVVDSPLAAALAAAFSKTKQEESAPEADEAEAPASPEAAAEAPADAALPAAEVAEAETADAKADAKADETGAEEEEAEVAVVPPTSPYDLPGSWFVVHSYSGYENKVKANLESRISSMHMEDRIFDVVIPMEDVVEFKGGRKVTVKKKVFPGYILARLYMDDDAWFVVRNTPGVTGFVGSGTKPTPLSRREVERILGVAKPEEGEKKREPRFKPEWEVGETVRVVEGPFADFNGLIEDINIDQQKVRVLVDIFGRETPVELSFEQIQKY